ncbi:amidase [Patulibacter sp. NPDC049589]|uniref:amidase n=1 Tax=Patulibacter sp. NPDC049589 TaxID=3154731 RepID=UPI00343308B4
MTDLPLTLTDAAAQLRDGTITSVELLRGMSARADEHDQALGVYLARFDDEALASAERADAELSAGLDRGPLHGVPIGVKDILAMSEGPTTAQSLVLDPAWGAGKDAPVVSRLRAAGAVLTGKLSTMEFACGAPDPEKPFPLPRNPWDPATWAGGSSSGSGAGVAAGMMYAGVGTDTGGSIRIPAIFCGVSGLMPTFGRVPKSGCTPLGYSLDHIGPLARSARDCGAFLQAIAGPDPTDPDTRDRPVPDFCATADGRLDGVRVGVERANHLGDQDDPALLGVFEQAVAQLEALGATVVEVVIPHYQEALTAMLVTCQAEMLAYHLPDLQTRWGDFFRTTRTMAAVGALFSGADYVQAQRVRRVAQRGLASVFADVDLIVAPAARAGAPTMDEVVAGSSLTALDRVHTAYWDAVGNPALVVPMGFTDGGLPLSLQLAARPFEEALLVRAGDAFQQATDWHLRVPPLVAETAVGA